jgi:hypothetical protein
MLQNIKEAIELFIKNCGLFSLIVLTVWLPGSILTVYLRFYVFPEMAGGDELRILVQELRINTAIETIFGPFYIGALLYASSQWKQGIKTSYRDSMVHAARKSFKLLRTRIVTGLIILVGFIAFIVPGIILSLRFALVDAVVVLEGKEGSSARNLSTYMTQGKRWHILGSITLTFIGVLFLLIPIDEILYLLLSFMGQSDNFVITVIYDCIVNILFSLPILVLFMFYWEAKRKRSSIELEDDGLT